jgi:hypothetical protein
MRKSIEQGGNIAISPLLRPIYDLISQVLNFLPTSEQLDRMIRNVNTLGATQQVGIFYRVLDILKTLPNDYDIIHFDYNRYSYILKKNLTIFESVNDDWDRIKLGCSGYQAVGYRSTNVLKKIIEMCEKNINGAHFDLFLFKSGFYETLNTYTPKTPLIPQNSMGSDNSDI